MNMNERIRAVFTALAVGDAMGMPTEFMTRTAIRERFSPLADGLIAPEQSEHHGNLTYASVTDDTEQNLYLYRLYRAAGRVDAAETASCLLRWADETGAAEKGYIGPSAKTALAALRAGEPPEKTGLSGTTCGGVMRTPAVVLAYPDNGGDALAQDIRRCLIPTHNTREALEAAGAYGFALHAALHGGQTAALLNAAVDGGQRLTRLAPKESCAPSTVARIREAYARARCETPETLLDYLYDVPGTGLPSADVCAAAFAIAFSAGTDVWLAIRMGASVGGDTDTIAALAGALCAAQAGAHNIPADVVETVFSANAILHGAPWEDAHEV